MIFESSPHAALLFKPEELKAIEEVCRHERRIGRYSVSAITGRAAAKLSSDVRDELARLDELVRSFINVARIKIQRPTEWTFALLSSDSTTRSYTGLKEYGLSMQRIRVLHEAYKTISRIRGDIGTGEYLAESITYNSLICKEKIELIEQALTAGVDLREYVSA